MRAILTASFAALKPFMILVFILGQVVVIFVLEIEGGTPITELKGWPERYVHSINSLQDLQPEVKSQPYL